MLEALTTLRAAGAEVVFLSGGEAEHLLDELEAAGGGTLDGGIAFDGAPYTGEARTIKGATIHVVLAEVVGRLNGLLVVRRDAEAESIHSSIVRKRPTRSRPCA